MRLLKKIMRNSLSWIKLLTQQLLIVIVLLNIVSLPLLWLGWGELPYTDKSNEKFRYHINPSHYYPHPYVGYTRTKNEDIEEINLDSDLAWSVFKTNGFVKEKHPTILIVGGSVAMHISSNRYDHQPIDESLGEFTFSKSLLSHYPNAEFRVVNAAYGGKKQPQQYLSTVYLDLLGLSYDMVINIDGFNEIALPIVENNYQFTPVIFPRSFFKIVNAFSKGECRISWSGKPSYIPFWDFYRSIKLRVCIADIQNPDVWFKHGKNLEKNDAINQSINIWKESSNKLFEFLQKREKMYIHAIQPNQYLEDSKPLSNDEEKALYFNEEGLIVRDHYLRLDSNLLKAEAITDLRYLFASTSETLYRDRCCHLNDKGMILMADQIISENEKLFGEMLSFNQPFE